LQDEGKECGFLVRAEEEGVRESRHEPESEEEMSSMRRLVAKRKGTAHDVELTGFTATKNCSNKN
jgi:hypothetical protein